MKRLTASLGLGVMALLAGLSAFAAEGLEESSADERSGEQSSFQVSVSGVSSGAYMAVQLQVAYSETFMGVGSIAGGPYFCAENMTDITEIKAKCMAGLGIIPDDYAPYREKAIKLSHEGKIDDVSNLGESKVFIFNSMEDQVINPGLGYLSVLFFQYFSKNPSDNVLPLNAIPGYAGYAVAHGLPTDMPIFDDFLNYADEATPCAPANSQQSPWFPNELYRGNDPWMYHCPYPNGYAPAVKGYSMAKDMLDHIYGDIKDEVPPNGRIRSYEQMAFVDDPRIKTVAGLHRHGIGEKMYAYVPNSCASGAKCNKLHVALHGCQQFPEWAFEGKLGSKEAGKKIQFGDLFYNGPFNGLAEANDIIMLYPQAHNIGHAQGDINPYGCWEFWPFYEEDSHSYYTQDGVGMRMIKNMVDHFTGRTRIVDRAAGEAGK